jgi:hypothetical protein
LGSINELISKIFDVLKSPKLLVWTALTSALLLYLPASILPYHGFPDLKNQYGIWGLLILIGSISMLAIEFVLNSAIEPQRKPSNADRKTVF